MYDEATEKWYAERDEDEVKSEERNCMRLARQFCRAMEKYGKWFIIYVLSKPSTWSVAAHLEGYHLHCTTEMCDDKEIDQLELDWITWKT